MGETERERERQQERGVDRERWSYKEEASSGVAGIIEAVNPAWRWCHYQHPHHYYSRLDFDDDLICFIYLIWLILRELLISYLMCWVDIDCNHEAKEMTQRRDDGKKRERRGKRANENLFES